MKEKSKKKKGKEEKRQRKKRQKKKGKRKFGNIRHVGGIRKYLFRSFLSFWAFQTIKKDYPMLGAGITKPAKRTV